MSSFYLDKLQAGASSFSNTVGHLMLPFFRITFVFHQRISKFMYLAWLCSREEWELSCPSRSEDKTKAGAEDQKVTKP